ncbi:uncharacterized protein LOC106156997 [Lingula anatina]|uniref:Uncharacterized protein LOC106156997 n=1 Tax=Lingula anatina TaxID=7574 RepID=A0A1S3HPD3_LINAN|nr:uncharacterized protein LOC106156997 [Lingula anatina]|eukprot:XP_013387913.1 uncharacterized protein LOC106156997 [Lingula anatina]
MKRTFLVFVTLLLLFCGESTRADDVNCDFQKPDICGYKNENTNGLLWEWANAKRKLCSTCTEFTVRGLIVQPYADIDADFKFSTVVSPKFTTTGPSCIHFDYVNSECKNRHESDASLRVHVRDAQGQEKAVHHVRCIRSAEKKEWHRESITIPSAGEYRLAFSAMRRYTSYAVGYVAITDVAVDTGACGDSASLNKVPGDCGFEDMDTCGYTYSNDSDFKWALITKENYYPDKMTEAPSGKFLAVTSSHYSTLLGSSVSKLLSPTISVAQDTCLTMSYHNDVLPSEDTRNVFNIYLRHSNGTDTLFHRVPKQYGERWVRGYLDLPRGDYKILFEANFKSYYSSKDYIGLDSVELFHTPCSAVKQLPLACDSANQNSGVSSSLCQRGGKCLSLGYKSYLCDCPSAGNDPRASYGLRCQYDMTCTNKSPCLNGGTCENFGRRRVECTCPRTYIGIHCETVIDCGDPTGLIPNSTLVSTTGTRYEDVAKFRCGDDSYLDGDGSATCQKNGQWYTRSVCHYVNCGQPVPLANSTLTSVTNTTLNGTASYKCNSLHQASNKADGLVTTCKFLKHDNPKSQWVVKDSAQCVPIPKCSEPPVVPHGRLVNISSRYEHGEAHYECDAGYRFHDQSRTNRAVICTSYGDKLYWNYTPMCVKIPTCGNPPDMANGKLVNVTNNTENGIAVYTCDTGYSFEGGKTTITCKNILINFVPQLKWDDSGIARCRKLPTCGQPPQVTNGHVVGVTNGSLDGTVTYQCNPGYVARGSTTAVCKQLSQWTAAWLYLPICEHVCQVPRGRAGNQQRMRLEIKRCTSSSFERFSVEESCYDPRSFVIDKNQSTPSDTIVFYGQEVCVAVETVKKLVSAQGFSKDKTEVKCESFCLNYISDYKRVLVQQRLVYQQPPSYSSYRVEVQKTYYVYKTVPLDDK